LEREKATNEAVERIVKEREAARAAKQAQEIVDFATAEKRRKEEAIRKAYIEESKKIAEERARQAAAQKIPGKKQVFNINDKKNDSPNPNAAPTPSSQASYEFTAINAQNGCPKGSQCEGWSLGGIYRVSTNA
jgi:membrane protein involved in colicin uptake